MATFSELSGPPFVQPLGPVLNSALQSAAPRERQTIFVV
jgi:hypothetical protein